MTSLLSRGRAGQQQQQQLPAVSEICLGCICEAVSNCNQSLGCQGDVCGVFRITWPYWADAGKPVLPQDQPEDPGGESSPPIQFENKMP